MGLGALCRPLGLGLLNSSVVFLKEASGWKLLEDWDSIVWVRASGILEEAKERSRGVVLHASTLRLQQSIQATRGWTGELSRKQLRLWGRKAIHACQRGKTETGAWDLGMVGMKPSGP